MGKNVLSTTPNWFNVTPTNSLNIGQENQFGSTRGLRYGPLRINKTGIFVNNGTLDSTIITETGFHGYGLSGIEQITLDASTGVNITDGTNSVFKAEISGTNVGDVTIGDYGNNAGVFYDKSANTFTFRGTLSTDIIVASGALTVGTNVGLGTAQDSAGVTTIIGNTVTTGFVNALEITAEYVVAGISISSPNIAGGFLVIGDANNNTFITESSGVGYVGFMNGGNIKGMFRGTSGTRGNGIVLDGGDMVLNNNRSFMIANSGTLNTSKYGGVSITNDNQFWLTLGTDNTFYMKNNAQDDNYFTVSNSQAYHKSKMTASEGAFTTINNTTLNGNEVKYWTLTYYSDKSLKKNISKLKPDFENLSKLESVEFKYKEDKGNNKHFGFIAQDFEKVYPNLVKTDENGIKGTDITQLIPLLVSAVNELKKEVTELKIKSL
jgi:hypothetical protein